MKLFFISFLFLWSLTLSIAEEPKLLARFEVLRGLTDDVAAQRKLVIVLYTRGNEIFGSRIVGDKITEVRLSTFESAYLLKRLRKLNLTNLDYQKYFDDLRVKSEKIATLSGSPSTVLGCSSI